MFKLLSVALLLQQVHDVSSVNIKQKTITRTIEFEDMDSTQSDFQKSLVQLSLMTVM